MVVVVVVVERGQWGLHSLSVDRLLCGGGGGGG